MLQPNELRVFVSSTFRDLQEEREHLVKKVFAEIRSLCRERGITFTEVDLRWGLTDEDVALGRIIRTCMEEIDQCRPYFIGITGERYGYVPSITDIYKDAELLKRYPWIEDAAMDGASLLDMEFRHAALNFPEQASRMAFFFRRDRATLNRPNVSHNQDRLEDLKQRVRDAGLQTEEYFDPHSLGEMVYNSLVRIIERDFANATLPTPLEEERARHQAFAASRRRAYIPNTTYLRRLNDLAQNEWPVASGQWQAGSEESPSDSSLRPHPSSPRLHASASHPSTLVITAPSGAGKSALLAYWAEQYKRRHPEATIIEHYVGIGAGPTDHYSIMRHVMLEMKERFKLEQDIPSTPEEIEQQFPNWLGFAKDSVVVLIDGLNQLAGPALNLAWLPRHIPPNICLIVSTTIDEMVSTLTERGWDQLELQPLRLNEREAIVVRFLSEYHKALSSDQVRGIAEDAKTAHPLFLKTLLEELRLFGSHEHLEHEIDRYLHTSDTEDLFQVVLERLEEDYGSRTVREVLSLVYLSRSGLSELELADISGISRMKLLSLVMGLDYHLVQHDGRLRFFHEYLRKAVGQRYLIQPTRAHTLRRKIAGYFQLQPTDSRKADELPWQLQQAEEWELLKKALTDVRLFELFMDNDRQYELLTYWVSLREHQNMVEAYQRVVDELEQTDLPQEYRAKLIERIGTFLQAAGEHTAAGPMLHRALTMREKLFGHNHPETAASLMRIGEHYRQKGEYDRAESFLRPALEVFENVFGNDDLKTAECLDHLATLLYEKKDYAAAEILLRRALEIYERTLGSGHPKTAKSIGDLATAIYLKGDFEEAERLMRRAVELKELSLGKDHSEVAHGYNNLSAILMERGELDAAVPLLECAITICEKTLGAGHPDTAVYLTNLGLVLVRKGDYAAAEPYCRRALEANRIAWGQEHPATARAMVNLGRLFLDAGTYLEAEQIFRQALDIRIRVLGTDHPDTVQGWLYIAHVLRLKGDLEESEKLYGTYLPLKEKHFGIAHPTMQLPMIGYIELLRMIGKEDEGDALEARLKSAGVIEK